jgi:hypothetical protein
MLGVSQECFSKEPLRDVRDSNDEPVSVAVHVEDESLSDLIGRCEIAPHVRKIAPFRFPRNSVEARDPCLGFGMPLGQLEKTGPAIDTQALS